MTHGLLEQESRTVALEVPKTSIGNIVSIAVGYWQATCFHGAGPFLKS
jgi:hypothetical protein